MIKSLCCGLLASCVAVTVMASAASARAVAPSETDEALQSRCVDILWEGVKNGQTFEKIHAGEALLWNGFPKGVKDAFLAELKTAELPYKIGVLRVLAQCGGKREHAEYVQGVREVFANTGNSMAARMAMIAMTTNSSIKVNPYLFLNFLTLFQAVAGASHRLMLFVMLS
jgi:hypothetical protein